MKYDQKEMEKRYQTLAKVFNEEVEGEEEDHYDEALNNVLELLDSKENVDEFAKYMNNMSRNELKTLSLLLEELNEENITKNFVEALKNLIKKYRDEDIIKQINPAGEDVEVSLIDYCEESLEYYENLVK